MRKLTFFFGCFFCIQFTQAQFVYKIKADSVKITNDSCTAELILENSTKHINGFLYNKGNGRTEFKKAMVKVDDSTYVFGGDTLNLGSLLASGGAGWKLTGNNITGAAPQFIGTSNNQPLAFRTNNLERLRIDENGNVGIGTSTPAYKLVVNGNTQITGGLFAGAEPNGIHAHIFGVGPTGLDNSVLIKSGPGSYYSGLSFETGANGNQGSITGYYGLYYKSKWHTFANGDQLITQIGDYGTSLIKLDATTTTATKFLIAEDNVPTDQGPVYNVVRYRTKAQLLSDLGLTAGWSPSGNAGTDPATQFFGTTDVKPLAFRTNNLERLRIDENGKTGIGTTSPVYKLDVNGDARVSDLPFLANRDTVLTYDPATQQLKKTKLPASAGPVKVSNKVDQVSTSTTVANSNSLFVNVTAGTYYSFKIMVVFRTAAITTGIKLTLTHAGATVFSARTEIPIGADGTASDFNGWMTASGDVVTSTGVQAANTDYIATIEGVILPSASGTLRLQFGSEVANSSVTLRNGSVGLLELF